MSIAKTGQPAKDLSYFTESLRAYISKRAFDIKELIQAVGNNQVRLLIKNLEKVDIETKQKLGLQQLENWTFSGKPLKAGYKAISLMILGQESGNLRRRFHTSTHKNDKFTARHELIFAVGLQGYLTTIANYQKAIDKALTEQDLALTQQLQAQFMKEVVQFESETQLLVNLLDNVKDCELTQIANELHSYLLGLKKQLVTNSTSVQIKSTTKNLFAELLAPIFENPLFTEEQYRKLQDKHSLLTKSYSHELISLQVSEQSCSKHRGQHVDNGRLLNDSVQILNLGKDTKITKQTKKGVAKYISAVKRNLNKQKNIEAKLAYLNAEIETFIPLRKKDENEQIESFDPHELALRELQVTLLKKNNKDLVKKLKREEKSERRLIRILLPHTKNAKEVTLAYSYRRLTGLYETLFDKAQLAELLKEIDVLHKTVGQFSRDYLQQPSVAMRLWNRITRRFGYNQGKGAYYDEVSLPSRLTAWEQAYAKTVAIIQEKLAASKQQNTKKADVGAEEIAVSAKQYYQTLLNTFCQDLGDNPGKFNLAEEYQALFNNILKKTMQFYTRVTTFTDKGFQQLYAIASSQASKLFADIQTIELYAKDRSFKHLLDGETDKEYFILYYILCEVALIEIKRYLCAELESQLDSSSILSNKADIDCCKERVMQACSWSELSGNLRDESKLRLNLLEDRFNDCAAIMKCISQYFSDASLQHFLDTQTQKIENESCDSDSEEQLPVGRKIPFHHYSFEI